MLTVAIRQELGPKRHLGSGCLLQGSQQQVSAASQDKLSGVCSSIPQQHSKEQKLRLCVKDAVWLAITREQESVPTPAST